MSKCVRKIHRISLAHQSLCVPPQALLQDTAAPPLPPPAAEPAVRAGVSRVLPLLLFSKVYRLPIGVVLRSKDRFSFEGHGNLTTHARCSLARASHEGRSKSHKLLKTHGLVGVTKDPRVFLLTTTLPFGQYSGP